MERDVVRYALGRTRRSAKNLLRSRLGLRRLEGMLSWRGRHAPDFLILGAQKAGTTALFHYLSRGSAMVAPERFEIHYFDINFWRGYRWYLSHFARERSVAEGRITGEKTPYYLYHPYVPQRVLATLPRCRFIVLLRDPVERAYSHFRHSREQGFETVASFREALALEEGRLRGEDEGLADPRHVSFAHQHYSYVSRGLYAEQLERWFRFFPPARFLVVQSERLFARPEEVLREVWEFLVGSASQGPGPFAPRNVGGYPPAEDAVKEQLRTVFREPNERLFELLGRRFDWARK